MSTAAAHMGAFKPPSQIPVRVSFPSFFFIITIIAITILITPSLANDNDSRNTNNNSSLAPATATATANANVNYTPFKPGIAVIIGALTTVFSITFLMLIYVKHCKRENGVGYASHAGLLTPSTIRKNSGIDRGVIESLPIFRFGALRGQKNGLECAVCLTKFELMEVLRLLPKCKHAFHVECVDTWLDGHSTCPLCRYRVDPEDILLIEDVKISVEKTESEPELSLKPEFRRVSGRHSSAGEFISSCSQKPTSWRRSLDGAAFWRKGEGEAVAVGCFDRPRKDGLLLTDGSMADRKSYDRRYEHRIIISAGGGFHQRWSDVQASDLLYLQSEMLIGDNRRFSSGSSRPSVKRQRQLQQQQMLVQLQHTSIDDSGGSGSGVINSRSVSEITGLSRFSNGGQSDSSIINRNNHVQRHAGLVSRWLAWISSQSQSQSQSVPAVRSDRTTDISNIV